MNINNMQQFVRQPQLVAHFNGTSVIPDRDGAGEDPELPRFKHNFHEMRNNRGQGLMTEFLFFTPKGTDEVIGGKAWDIVSVSDDYDLGASTSQLLKNALKQGLLDRLPPNLLYVENGPGYLEAWKQKSENLVQALVESDEHEIQSALIVDNSSRYAKDTASYLDDNFAIPTVNAYNMDFINTNSDRNIPETRGTPFIVTWGGAFANAPRLDGQYTAFDVLETSFHNMRRQHGLGACFLIEIELPDEHNDATYMDKLKESYAVSPQDTDKRQAFNNFVISGFHRAVYNGVISDPDYNPAEYWEARTDVRMEDTVIKDADGTEMTIKNPVVDLQAVPKKDHTMPLIDQSLSVSREDAPRSQILSHKWPTAVYDAAAKLAGSSDNKFYRHGNRALMFGRFTQKR